MRSEATVVSQGMLSLTAGDRPATRWKAHNINKHIEKHCSSGIVSSLLVLRNAWQSFVFRAYGEVVRSTERATLEVSSQWKDSHDRTSH